MSLSDLEKSIKAAVDKRVTTEARAMRGVIKNGRFCCGGKSYTYTKAVDCDSSEGNKVWAQLSQNNSAVIVGE